MPPEFEETYSLVERSNTQSPNERISNQLELEDIKQLNRLPISNELELPVIAFEDKERLNDDVPRSGCPVHPNRSSVPDRKPLSVACNRFRSLPVLERWTTHHLYSRFPKVVHMTPVAPPFHFHQQKGESKAVDDEQPPQQAQTHWYQGWSKLAHNVLETAKPLPDFAAKRNR